MQAIATNVLQNQQAIDKMDKEQKPLLTSCNEIKTTWPQSLSGYYQLVSKKGPVYVYCHMEELCSSAGGWTRIAYLDMSDSTEACPTGFKLYQSGGVRACGRQSSSPGCQSVKFSSYGISYSQVCGRVVGYQYGSPDAVDPTLGTGHNNINSHYVDGISLTHGSPRHHIWTFMAGLIDSSIFLDGRFNCLCSQGSTQKNNLQSFIGNDYFCESGNQDQNGQFMYYRLYTNDSLWDGRGCGTLENTCCQAPGLPWFHKALNSNTTDYIEMRVCGDQPTADEDVPVGYYEIYVK